MYLVASSPRTVVREGVLGLAARRDGSERNFYAFGPIAFKLLVSYGARVNLARLVSRL